MTTGAGAGGGGGGGGSVGGSVGGSADAYRQSSSASPRGVVTGGGYCGSSASTPHSHSTNGSYSVANPYTGSPTLYTSRKYILLLLQTLSLCFPIFARLASRFFRFVGTSKCVSTRNAISIKSRDFISFCYYYSYYELLGI